MPELKVAHLNQGGHNMIVVPVDPEFGSKPQHEQLAIVAELQSRSKAAGLAGTVVPVWDNGRTMSFIAPQPWHPFFKGISLDHIRHNLNKRITW